MNGEESKINRSIGTVSFYTFLSRILGLVRDITIAWAFGATRTADIYYVAFRIPNMLRRLVAEGALTISFVPVYTEYLKISRREAQNAFSVVFTYLSIFLIILVASGIIFSPSIVKLMAWGFSKIPDKFDHTIYLTRLMFPYIFLIGLTALAMGVLNSLKHFAAPAASPIFLNIGIIFGAVVLSRVCAVPTTGLAIGVLMGGVMQLALQVKPLISESMLPKINFNWHHPALRRLLLLMGPSAIGASVYQLNILVITLFASFLQEGSVSYLSYADRINEFPLGIFSIAIATVMLPTLSEHGAANNIELFRECISRSLRLSFLISIPSAIGLHILSPHIIEVLLQRGEFNQQTALATSNTLIVLSYQIPFVSGVRNLVPGFFALKDSKTPVIASAVSVLTNIVTALFLVRMFSYIGLAMAIVISSVVNFFMLIWLFRRKVKQIAAKQLAVSILKTSIAGIVMALSLIVAMKFADGFDCARFITKLFVLLALIFIGILVFLTITKIINADEYSMLKGMIFVKRKNFVTR